MQQSYDSPKSMMHQIYIVVKFVENFTKKSLKTSQTRQKFQLCFFLILDIT